MCVCVRVCVCVFSNDTMHWFLGKNAVEFTSRYVQEEIDACSRIWIMCVYWLGK